jgi:hypothetical protein
MPIQINQKTIVSVGAVVGAVAAIVGAAYAAMPTARAVNNLPPIPPC